MSKPYVALDYREPTPERQAAVDAQWAEIIAWLTPRRLRIHIPLKGAVYFTKKHPDET